MKNFLLILASFLIIYPVSGQSFKSQQLLYPRVREAYSEKEDTLLSLYKEKGFNNLAIEIYLRVFKNERIIEVWGKGKTDTVFIHIKNYNFCSFSGKLGPKRKQGDMQTPEGFYYIDRFNPYSSFYLSLGINYPNSSDRKLSSFSNLGGDIFIHGSCCTIGCIPITDDKIKELYIITTEAKNIGQNKIPVHIFPAKITNEKMNYLKSKFSIDNTLLKFWINLKEVYDYFEIHKNIPKITVDSKGKYIISN